MSASVHPADGTLALPARGARPATATVDAVTADRSSPASLWARRDVVQLVVLSVLGVVLMAAGWYMSGDGQPLDQQMPRLDLAVGGLLIGVLGGGLFLIRGLRGVADRKATVKALAARRVAARATATPLVATDELVAAADMTRYHRAACPLVAGKPVAAAGRAEHERRDRRPCGLCLREAPAEPGAPR
jgi:hypothetical protein